MKHNFAVCFMDPYKGIQVEYFVHFESAFWWYNQKAMWRRTKLFAINGEQKVLLWDSRERP